MKRLVFWDTALHPGSTDGMDENICSCYEHHTGLLLGMFFDSEDGGDMSLRNVCSLSTNYRSVIFQ
jgi:hypothetical protein